jgi:hypothetical protein
VTASAEGHVTRASDSVVSIDLDGDGYEQTGWVLVYLHLAELDAIALGSLVSTDGLLGHPSSAGIPLVRMSILPENIMVNGSQQMEPCHLC